MVLRPKPLPTGVVSNRPKPALPLDWRDQAVLACEPDLSLLQRAPPVPPLLFYFPVSYGTGLLAAPHARARGDHLLLVAVTAVPREQQDPRRIWVVGLCGHVQKPKDALHLGRAAVASSLVAAARVRVCDPPV